jgi:hypothetical protein
MVLQFFQWLKPQWTCLNSMDQDPPWEADSYSGSQEITHLYGNWKFITMFKTACQWPVSWDRWIQSTPYSFKTYFNTIPSPLCLLQPVLFTSSHRNTVFQKITRRHKALAWMRPQHKKQITLTYTFSNYDIAHFMVCVLSPYKKMYSQAQNKLITWSKFDFSRHLTMWGSCQLCTAPQNTCTGAESMRDEQSFWDFRFSQWWRCWSWSSMLWCRVDL